MELLLLGKGILAFWLFYNGEDWNVFGFPDLGPGIEDEKRLVILLLVFAVLFNWFWLVLLGGNWEGLMFYC